MNRRRLVNRLARRISQGIKRVPLSMDEQERMLRQKGWRVFDDFPRTRDPHSVAVPVRGDDTITITLYASGRVSIEDGHPESEHFGRSVAMHRVPTPEEAGRRFGR